MIPEHQPFILDHVIFTKVSVASNPLFNPASRSSERLANVQTVNLGALPSPADQETTWTGHLRVVVDGGDRTDVPYTIEIVALAYYRFTQPVPRPTADVLVTATAHNVLWGAAREHILSITSRQGNGPFLLGLSTFKPRLEEVEESPDLNTERPVPEPAPPPKTRRRRPPKTSE